MGKQLCYIGPVRNKTQDCAGEAVRIDGCSSHFKNHLKEECLAHRRHKTN